MPTEFILIVTAFFAGMINSVAGGGTFFTFPMLLFVGVPPISANATSSFAVFPGQFSSAFAYREDFSHLEDIPMWAVLSVSLVGGWLGSAVLLATPQKTFVGLIPWLLLTATILFAAGKHVGAFISARIRLGAVPIAVLLFAIAFYGGYFGAGIGIMTLAVLSLLGLTDLNKMNAVKTITTGAINVAAITNFIYCGAIAWHPAAIMSISTIIGGYTGASMARKLDQRIIWWIVLSVGVSLTIYFFARS